MISDITYEDIWHLGPGERLADAAELADPDNRVLPPGPASTRVYIGRVQDPVRHRHRQSSPLGTSSPRPPRCPTSRAYVSPLTSALFEHPCRLTLPPAHHIHHNGMVCAARVVVVVVVCCCCCCCCCCWLLRCCPPACCVLTETDKICIQMTPAGSGRPRSASLSASRARQCGGSHSMYTRERCHQDRARVLSR